ncbi:hypothetical protein [uncultured Polaribacter sp.]|uniref:hypothetical protein n=1 Tax=uncultured Polaribacter sp. TaxID=174711 RepID=UPI002634A42A|nr:hypothetical protein [uncultured Polaribacter sp.]
MIIDQEEKFKLVFENLKERPNEINMFAKFLDMFPSEWKQLKINFSKFNRSKQFGRTIPLPKPEQSLKKEIRIWLKKQQL